MNVLALVTLLAFEGADAPAQQRLTMDQVVQMATASRISSTPHLSQFLSSISLWSEPASAPWAMIQGTVA